MKAKKICSLVFGSYINTYCVIRELYYNKIRDIVVFDFQKRCSAYSNMKIKFRRIERLNSEDLLEKINELHEEYDFIIIFPTDELHILMLLNIYDKIETFCFLPFNKNFEELSSKYSQYLWCKKLDVPCPETKILRKPSDYYLVKEMLPAIIKPNSRYKKDLNLIKVFSEKDYYFYKNLIQSQINDGYEFVVSEIIPGDDDCVYAYTCYRSKDGKILNGWVGHKLSQHPDSFGTFASAESCINNTVLNLGKRLVNGMGLCGIVEPEFKYDFRDGKFKLTEINFRIMMWHRVGFLAGVHLLYSQYLDSTEKSVEQFKQDTESKRLCYLKYEIMNLLNRPNYLKKFFRIISKRFHFCVFNLKDPKPFIIDCLDLIRRMRKWVEKKAHKNIREEIM